MRIIPHAMPMQHLLFPLLLAIVCLVSPAFALDTSEGFGLQDRALFQEKVDYTLTNQTGTDFHGQQLQSTSFAGAVGRQADFHGANLHGAIMTQGAFSEADFHDADLSDARGCQVHCDGRTQPARTNTQHAGSLQFLLPCHALIM